MRWQRFRVMGVNNEAPGIGAKSTRRVKKDGRRDVHPEEVSSSGDTLTVDRSPCEDHPYRLTSSLASQVSPMSPMPPASMAGARRNAT